MRDGLNETLVPMHICLFNSQYKKRQPVATNNWRPEPRRDADWLSTGCRVIADVLRALGTLLKTYIR